MDIEIKEKKDKDGKTIGYTLTIDGTEVGDVFNNLEEIRGYLRRIWRHRYGTEMPDVILPINGSITIPAPPAPGGNTFAPKM